MGRNNFIAYLQRYQILIFIFFTINFICWKVKYRNCLVYMYVWNTQGNLYVSGRIAANENHTLWFWRWRTFSSTSSRDIQWLVTFQRYHIPGSDRLCSTKRAMRTDTLKIKIIWFYQLSWQCKLATVKRFESWRSDEGLTLETSAFESLYGG